MFEENAEEKKAGMIGAAIIGGVGALAGVIGTIAFGKGKKLWDEKHPKADAQANEK